MVITTVLEKITSSGVVTTLQVLVLQARQMGLERRKFKYSGGHVFDPAEKSLCD
jgi:hypothetical protein